MAKGVFENGKIVVEVCMLKPERLLNILWNKNINVINVKKIDIVTLRITIEYDNYNDVVEVVKSLKGKIEVVGSKGILFFIGNLKGKLALTLGSFLFIAVLFYLSTFVWSIEINTKENLSPFEVRQQLYSLGIKPGIKKDSIDYKELEKKIENINSEVLWIRARVEGSTLKINIEEKVNPPEIIQKEFGNLVSKMDGEVTRVYTFSGTALVKPGDYVKNGDIVIQGINGSEETPYECVPDGVVMANTFYEKSMVA